MELKEGWLLRQIQAASAEVATWSNSKKEVMFCCNGHTWMHPTYPKENMQLLTCKCCAREMVRFSWGTSFVIVKRGEEGNCMHKQTEIDDHILTNRQKAQIINKTKFWCYGCDGCLVGKCPNCGWENNSGRKLKL
jgi:hypothetical protein